MVKCKVFKHLRVVWLGLTQVHRYMMRHCTTVLQLLASQQPLVLRVLPARLCNAALRLVAEAADNACKRIEFSARSVAPILIVRDLGNIVFAFGTKNNVC